MIWRDSNGESLTEFLQRTEEESQNSYGCFLLLVMVGVLFIVFILEYGR